MLESQRRETGGITVVELQGTPEQIGEAHGRLLAREVRRACVELVEQRVLPGVAGELFGDDEKKTAGFASWCRDKARRFARQIDDRYRAEIRALARAAGVDEAQVLLAQVLLDVLEQAGLTHSDQHFHACTQVQGAVARLRAAPRTNGYHTLIASGREAAARVVLHSATASAVRPPRDGIAWGVDIDRMPAIYEEGEMPPPAVPLTDETSEFRYGRLGQLLAGHPGPVGAADLQAWLDDRIDIETGQPDTTLHCLANETTLQSLVADLSAGELHVAMGAIPASAGGYVSFRLDGSAGPDV